MAGQSMADPLVGLIFQAPRLHHLTQENSNLCDILMLERALENEAHHVSAHGTHHVRDIMINFRDLVSIARYIL